MEIENVLRGIYYDQKNPNSFSSAEKLYNAAKDILQEINLPQVKEWLSGELTYTLHKPVRKTYKRNPIIVEEIDQQWEADLVDMREFKNKNKGNNYLLTVIDVLSKYAWAIPLRDKKSQTIIKAFTKIFLEKKPIFLRTDKGKEFLNKFFKGFLKNNKVYHFTSNNSDIKCAIVERFNRTLKGRMFKYFTANGTRVWYNVIDDLITAYNSSKHSSIKMSPVEALKTDSKILFKNIYKVDSYEDIRAKDPKLNLGDKVRKAYKLSPFEKSYYPNWTDHVYTVNKTANEPEKPMYRVKNEEVSERLYPEQLQKVKENLFRVEKILKKRLYKGERQSFVKWLNYPDSYNSWVNDKNIVHLNEKKT